MRNRLFYLFGLAVLFISCTKKQEADLIFINGNIHTVDDNLSIAQAMAVRGDRIVAVGETKAILKKYKAAEVIDLAGQNVYPGFIDPHSHFMGYSMNLMQATLWMSKSMDEIVERLRAHREKMQGEWLLGRGWDQNLFEVTDMPDNSLLNEAFPDTPVFIVRVDGHAAVANQKALELAGLDAGTTVDGGEVVVRNGKPTGLLIDKAMTLVSDKIPPLSDEQLVELLVQGQKDMFEVGLTSVCDAGLSRKAVLMLDSLQKKGILNIRVYAMLEPSEENFAHFLPGGPYQTDHLTVSSIKLYADGALGSRGAMMKEDYTDKKDWRGIQVDDTALMQKVCELAIRHGYQVNTHCIGDSAVSLMLNLYAGYLEKDNDRRWRIEHAQIVDPADINLFGEYKIVPSIQTIHAVSDMGWAEQRIGAERIKGAYAWRDLMNQAGWMPNGSDYPVEHINPLYSFHAAFTRTDSNGNPSGGWYPSQLLTRQEALKGMTLWAAKANFEETSRGSLEQGKLADFVIMDADLMTVDEKEIYTLGVNQTWVGGKRVK